MKKRSICMLLAVIMAFNSVNFPVSAEEVSTQMYGEESAAETEVLKDSECMLYISTEDVYVEMESVLEDESLEASESKEAEVEIEGNVETTAEVVASGACGVNLTWTLTADGVLTITGTGEMYDLGGAEGSAWNPYSESIVSLKLENGMTSIGDGAFCRCTNLTGTLVIPSSVTRIGSNAFSDCSGLTGDLVIPEGVVSIGSQAFSNCSGFTGKLTISDSVTSIGESAFTWCSGLTGDLVIPESVISISDSVFSGCSGFTGKLRIPDSVINIGVSAFSRCSGLTGELRIPETVESIGNGAFTYCSGLTGELIIPKGITSIEGLTFWGCNGLTGELKIPESVTSIGDYAFYNCSGLTGKLTIPDGVTSIGTKAFYWMSGLDGSIYIPESVLSIGLDAFDSGSTIYGIAGSYAETYANENGISFAVYGVSGEITLTGKCGANLTWTLTADGVLTITGTGEMYNYEESHGSSGELIADTPWYPHRENIVSLKLEDGINTIGDSAFLNCTALKGELVIPESVTSIGNCAFCACSGLTGNLIIPESVASIGYNAFTGCSGFTGDLVISDSVTSIGRIAFNGCSGFNGKLVMPNNITYIGEYAFSQCSGLTGELVIPASVTSIGEGTFTGCSGLTGELVIPAGVTSIGDRAFSGCNGLIGELIIPERVTSVGAFAFQNCSGFTGNLVISESVTDIGEYAFSLCGGLTGDLVIPEGVTDIGEYAFWQCYGFKGNLVIPGSVTSIGNGSFKNCYGLTGDLIIPDSVTSIGDEAFQDCSGLTGKLVIAESVTSIGDNAFDNCNSLIGDLVLPQGVTRIGHEAFRNCRGLTGDLIIPEGATSIGMHAFIDCCSLSGSAYIPVSVVSIAEDAFLDVINTIYGAVGSYAETYARENGIAFVAYDFEQVVASGECGETLSWSLDISGKLTISGTGSMYDYSSGTAPWYSYREQMRRLEFENGVTCIGAYAFSNCNSLMGDLVIPESVVYIGNGAFLGCDKLSGKAYIPASVISIGMDALASIDIIYGMQGSYAETYAGENDISFVPYGQIVLSEKCGENLVCALTEEGVLTISGTGDMYDYEVLFDGVDYGINTPWYPYRENIVSLKLENGITAIGANAFCECTALMGALVIPESVTHIGENAFQNCSGLTGDLIIPQNVTSIGAFAFQNCSGFVGKLVIPESVTDIGAYAFSLCSSLTGDLRIPQNLTSIEDAVFWRCRGLTGDLVIPEGVTTIGASAFMDCRSLTGKLVIPESVTNIGAYAFSMCSGLTGELVIPDNVTYIGEYAFDSCSGLTGELMIPDNTTYVGDYAFAWCFGFTGDLIIPESLTVINPYTFYNCVGLKGKLVLPDTITNIGDYAFADCYGLTGDLVIPNSVTSVGDYAFFRCNELSGKAYIPSSVTSIAEYAFASNYKQVDEEFVGDGSVIDTIYGTADSYAEEFANEKEIVFVEYDFEKGAIAEGTCGETLSWSLEADGTLRISGMGAMNDFALGTAPWYGYREYMNNLEFEGGVTGIGAYAFYDCDGLTRDLQIPLSVTNIGAYAFADCNGLIGDLVIPEGVMSIGEGAFSGCDNLSGEAYILSSVTDIGTEALSAIYIIYGSQGSYVETYANENNIIFVDEEFVVDSGKFYGTTITWIVTNDGTLIIAGKGRIPNRVIDSPWTAYRNEIKTLKLGNGIEEIGDGAFENCSNLTGSLVIPESVTSIGTGAFQNCSSLTGDLIIPKNVTVINNYAFFGCSGFNGNLILPEGLESIENGVFQACSGLTGELVIPDGVTKIGGSAFYQCSGFTGNLIIPESVTSIGEMAFLECSGFTGDLVIPESVTSIGRSAFLECTGFTGNLLIPNSITEIGNSAFYNCSGFTGGLSISKNLTSIEEFVFYGCKGLTGDLIIPESVTSIGGYAFAECSGLTGKLIISESVISIDSGAFQNCSSLTGNLILPSEITSIESSIFSNCSGLTGELVIPENVVSIGSYAFYGCGGLTGGLVIPENVISIEREAFSYCSFDGELVLPSALKEIGDLAFAYCSFKEELLIPKDVTYIGDYAFSENEFTGRLILPQQLSDLGEGAFKNSGDFTGDLLIPEGVTNIGAMTFYGCNFDGELTLPQGLTKIEYAAFDENDFTGELILPESLTEIGAAAFYGNSFTGDLSIPEGITFIGYRTFAENNFTGCLKLPESLMTIGDEAFYLAGFIGELILPKGLTMIGSHAFGYCGFTGDLIIPNGVESLGSGTFYQCRFENAYIPPSVTVIMFPYNDLPALVCLNLTIYGVKGSEAERYAKEIGYQFIEYDFSVRYAVTFDSAGGSTVVRQRVKPEQTATEPETPVREGYEFLGWYLNGELYDFTKPVTGDITLTAKWKKICRVSFDLNYEGAESMESQNVPYNEAYGALPTVLRAGYLFTGWYTAPEAGMLVTAETIVTTTESHTLYAHWEHKYTTAAPTANIKAGSEVEAGTRLSLRTETNGASIYYTTDTAVGTNVSPETGTLYEDAIELTENVTIYAIAVKSGYNDSEVLTVSYTVRDDSQNWGDITEADRAELGFAATADVPETLWLAGVSDCDYTGKAITYPDLHVYHHKTLLKEKTDYTVKYKNNTKAGTATVTITGKGNYAGSITKTFTIRPLDLSNATILDVMVPYNKKVQKATTTVTYFLNGKEVTLKKGTDFNYIYPGTDKKADDYDADAFKEAGTYTVYLTGKGNYYTDEANPVTFTVRIVDEPLISKMSLTKIPNQKYTGEEITPSVTLKHGGKTLTEGTDYEIVDYIDNVGVGTATIVIEGRGEYVGSRTATFKITGTALSKVKMSGFSKSLPWTGDEVKQEISFTHGEDTLTEGIHYTVSYEKNIAVGKATVIYTGVEEMGYTGTVKKTFQITGLPINKAVVSGLLSTIAYDGGDNTQSGYALSYVKVVDGVEQTIPLYEDADYTVSYKNNEKAGTATITFTGINGYTGTLKKTYKIQAYNLADEAGRISVSEISEQNYLKGGAMPKPEVVYTTTNGQPIVLTEGKDYTLKYSNHKEVADKTAKKAPTVTITGKGNFAGTKTQKFTIVGSDISAVTMTASDVVYQKKANICKSSIVLYDADGKKLSAGTDYSKTVTYTYAKDVEVTQVVNKQTIYITRLQGEEVDKKDIIPVGAEITATVTGMKNYAGDGTTPSTQSATFRFVAANIAKAKVSVVAQTYTGKAVEPTKDDITVKFGNSSPLAKTDYEIVGYSNNVKKGTAKVTVRGIGNYGGEKTVTFKINSKSMNYTIVYDKNAEDATGTMKASSLSAGKLLSANTYKRTGYTFVGWNTKADGSGEAYSNKEAFYLKGFMWVYGRNVTLYAQWEAK